MFNLLEDDKKLFCLYLEECNSSTKNLHISSGNLANLTFTHTYIALY